MRETTTKTYRMKMRVVRGAPYFDTVEVSEPVFVQATNANAAEAEAKRRLRVDYPEARDVYAATRRRVTS